jgi:ABC-2 type transport system permease protein
LVLMAIAVRAVNSDGIGDVAFVAVELSRFPVELYRNPVQTVLTIVPVAFFTTFPTQALLGQLSIEMTLVGPALASALMVMGSWTFQRSLRSYCGASG